MVGDNSPTQPNGLACHLHWSLGNTRKIHEKALSTLNIKVAPKDIFNSTPLRTNVIHTHFRHLRKFVYAKPSSDLGTDNRSGAGWGLSAQMHSISR